MLSEWRRRLHLWDPNGYVPPSNSVEVDKVEEFKKSKIAQDIQKAFPDAKLIDLKEEE